MGNIPTDNLTTTIIQNNNYSSDDMRIKLLNYRWNKELEDFIYNIKTNKWLEEHLKTLKEVYELGYNIGQCGLTSRYIVIGLVNASKDARLCIGTFDILKGSKDCKDGNHAWVLCDGFYIDPTTRTCISESLASKMGYTLEREIKYDNNKDPLDFLPEYATYDNYYRKYEGKEIPEEDFWYKQDKVR